MTIGDVHRFELRVGFSIYWATIEQTAVEGWEVRWEQHGRHMTECGSTRRSAIDAARRLAAEANR